VRGGQELNKRRYHQLFELGPALAGLVIEAGELKDIDSARDQLLATPPEGWLVV